MITVPHILLTLAVAAGYAVLCLVKPHRGCGRCKRTGRSKRYLGLVGPQGKCRRCNGRKRHPRRFAGAVHWFAWSAIVEPFRERREGRGQQFSAPPPRRRPAGQHAAYARAQQRADRLIAFQARLQARTARRAWQFA